MSRKCFVPAVTFFAIACLGATSCNAVPPTIYCVFESEVLAGGRCLTQCESRCNLQTLAGCAPSTCVDDCDRAESRLDGACLDARYTYWRCLRRSGQPAVTCSGDTPVFSVRADTCATERSAMDDRCPAGDGGIDDGGT